MTANGASPSAVQLLLELCARWDYRHGKIVERASNEVGERRQVTLGEAVGLHDAASELRAVLANILELVPEGSAGPCGEAAPHFPPFTSAAHCELRAGHIGQHTDGRGSIWSVTPDGIRIRNTDGPDPDLEQQS